MTTKIYKITEDDFYRLYGLVKQGVVHDIVKYEGIPMFSISGWYPTHLGRMLYCQSC